MNYDRFIYSMSSLGMNNAQIESLCGLHDALFEAEESKAFNSPDNLPIDMKENIEYDDKNDEPLDNMAFDHIDKSHADDMKGYIVTLNGKQNVINFDGSLRFDEWYAKIDGVYNWNVCILTNDEGKKNVSIDGLPPKLPQWADELDMEYGRMQNFILVKYGDKCNSVSTNPAKMFALPEMVDEILETYRKYYIVKKDGMCNVVNPWGEYISSTWFDTIRFTFSFGQPFEVEKDGARYYMDIYGYLEENSESIHGYRWMPPRK